MHNIPRWIAYVPTSLHQAWSLTTGCLGAVTSGVTSRVDALRARIAELTWESLLGKPLHMRYIEPLDATDWTILKRCWITAVVVVVVSARFFFGIFPLGLGTGVLLIGGSCHWTRHRVEGRANERAWAQLDQIRRNVHSADLQPNTIAIIRQHMEELKKTQFDHLSKRTEPLDKQLHAFLNLPLANAEERAHQKQNLMSTLEAFMRHLNENAQLEDLTQPTIHVQPDNV